MSNQKTVCFSCLTPYHVFVAYILSKTLYKNCYKVILFSDHYHQQIYERALGLNLWDKIILIEERNKSWAQIHSQLKTINLEDMDVLHYFSWGSIFQLLLIREIPEKTKVILTEEGVGTYYIQEAVAHWKTNYSPHSSPIDFDKVSEIWLFDKRLYVSELIKPLQDIAFYRYLSSPLALEFCKDLNTLFAYTPQQRE
ncbi:MAG: polysialyltransferase family glycosyltransferase [Thermotaleaceae bacterium]